MNFISELKRRNVIRMAGLYLVGAWLITQVAGTVLPMFNAPAWLPRSVVIALAIGFIPALIFSWVFELTPDGLKRDNDIKLEHSIAPETARRMEHTILVLFAIALAFFAFDKIVLAPKRDAALVATTTQAVKAESLLDIKVASLGKSIAVLPFENLSTEKDNAFFADGIQDEILTGLAKIGELKVISRTSTQRYASRPVNIAEIAKQLGVAHILEGGVQRSGNRVRINVQLIDAASDNHLWAETYDRTLDDVFAVQSEVAQKIAAALQARLTQDELATLTTKPTENTAAYDAYLRGRAFDAQGNDVPILRKATQSYAEAVRLDPNFALAWAALAVDRSYLYFNGVEQETYTAESVKQAADAAFRLQPKLDEALLAQGYYRYRVLADYPAAAQAFETVLLRSSNDPHALKALGYVERRLGKWQQALRLMQQANERDPRNPGLMSSIGGEILFHLRRYDEERLWLDRALSLAPDSMLAIDYKATSYQAEGRLQDAASVFDAVPPAARDARYAQARSYQYLLERDYDKAMAELQPILARPKDKQDGFGPVLLLNLAWAQRYSGDSVKSKATLERLIEQIESQEASNRDSSLNTLALAYAGLGEYTLALEQARHAIEVNRYDAIEREYAQVALAQVQTMAGDHVAAIANLARSLQVPAGISLGYLQLDPVWDPLRKEASFQKLIVDAKVTR